MINIIHHNKTATTQFYGSSKGVESQKQFLHTSIDNNSDDETDCSSTNSRRGFQSASTMSSSFMSECSPQRPVSPSYA